MGVIKRIIRTLTRHKVKISGDVTFSLGKFKPAPEMLVAGGTHKQTQLSKLMRSLSQTDKIIYFIHVEVDNCYNLGSSDAIGLSDPFVILYLNGVEFGRTSIKDNTCSPVWQFEAFEIPVFESVGVPCLTIAVYDMDADGVGDFLGNW
jgi:Ca2+-dependent lipid-binding protein